MSVLTERCACCGHTLSFHGRQAGSKCRAVGCRKGPGGKRPCQGFEAGQDASEELLEALSAPS